ncbi:MAG: hypothetical protein DRO06_00340 [Thermoproteota archaeon]|nr:MAG: hypothetical protein DRO06_00340 [Candidatus Korarchaeota archaeon]
MLLPLSSPLAQREYNPLVFEWVEVSVSFQGDGSAVFEMRGMLKNEGEVVVVPGYGFLKVSAPSVEDLSARGPGGPIEATVSEEGDLKVIRYSLWEPLEPGEAVNVSISFRVPSASSGLLFREAVLGVGGFSSSVERGVLQVSPPPGSHITYSSRDLPLSLDGLPQGEGVEVEVEFGPLPARLPVKASIATWTAVLAVLAVVALKVGRGRG